MIVGRCGVLSWGIFHLQFPLVPSQEFHLVLKLCWDLGLVAPFSPISRNWIDGNGDGPLVGIGSCSLVKTDLK